MRIIAINDCGDIELHYNEFSELDLHEGKKEGTRVWEIRNGTEYTAIGILCSASRECMYVVRKPHASRNLLNAAFTVVNASNFDVVEAYEWRSWTFTVHARAFELRGQTIIASAWSPKSESLPHTLKAIDFGLMITPESEIAIIGSE